MGHKKHQLISVQRVYSSSTAVWDLSQASENHTGVDVRLCSLQKPETFLMSTNIVGNRSQERMRESSISTNCDILQMGPAKFEKEQVRFVSVKAERPNHPSRYHAR